MKTRFILSAAAILIVTGFAIMGCGYIDNDGNGGHVDVSPAQFEKGVALFGHDVETGSHFTNHLYPYLGAGLAGTRYDYKWESMTPIWIAGKQYVMGHSSDDDGDNHYDWFIQRIYPTGDFGPQTDSGHFCHHYKTLITLTRPSGDVFIYGQRDYADNASFTRQVLPGGILADNNADSTHRAHYYDATTPLPNNHHTCFYAQDSDDGNHWIIDCIHSDGTFFSNSSGNDHDAGTWGHGYQVALSYREGDQSHLFGHRHHYGKGPWYIQNITTNSYMGIETDYGDADNGDQWNNYYQTMTTFFSPETKMQYLIGHNTDKHYFIQHVSSHGHMCEEIQHGGPWPHYYEHLFPIDFDPSCLHVDNWMEYMIDELDGFYYRKLSQIALPASHDSGMNGDDIHGCSAGGRWCNTQTQWEDIGGQLSLGARYFDIRPMIDTGDIGSEDWTTGHAAKVGTDITGGCRGESKSSIINSLNAFFADGKHAKELVILKVAHCMTPPGNGYATCTADQRSAMAHDLASQLDHVVKGDLNLNDMTLQEILHEGNIILVVQGARDLAEGIFQWGYGSDGDYYVYDSYSNTEEFSTMKNDQIDKLLELGNHAGHNHYNGFLLSWTLTLSTGDAIDCPLGSPPDILDMAVKAQPKIYMYMNELVEEGKITKTLFPNLLYVDTFNRTTTNAAIYLNRQYDSLED